MEAQNALIPIHPYEDSRVTHNFATVNGRRYHYVLGEPRIRPARATVLCVHGFPDIWYGWRYIIPGLLDMGLRVIVPDMIGYGQTDAPTAATQEEELKMYSWKSSAQDMKMLLKQLNIHKVVLFGHDWGGVIVQRIYFWYPEIVTHIISVCTAFNPPIKEDIPLEEIVRRIPNFKYQLRLVEPQTEKDFESVEAIGRFLRAVYRGIGDPGTGNLQVDSDLAKNIGDQPIPKVWTEEDYAYYLKEYTRHGLHAPLNWYKSRSVNYQEEKDLKFDKVKVPFLYLGAERDIYTPPRMAKGQAQFIEKLTSHDIVATHWVLAERPKIVLAHVGNFLVDILGDRGKL